MNYHTELAAALDAAHVAAEYLRREYDAFVPIPDAPVSISTHADRGAQDLIIAALTAAFPADAVCAEESTAGLANAIHDARRVWVIDPIDGTRGFATKNGEFSVMIGLTVDRVPVLGVVSEPVPRRVTFAVAGEGCFAQDGERHAEPRRLRVSGAASLADAVLVRSHGKPGRVGEDVRVIGPKRVVETYSAGVKLAIVARGEADLYPNTYSQFADWDICAGHVLVTEAGGTVTQLKGDPLTYGNAAFRQHGGILATNGLIHDEAVRRLKVL
jgi:3'(2'), 5'-bisphosphate nucleotidase